MNSKNLIAIVIIGLLVLFGFRACSGYNNLVQEDNNVQKVWGNVQNQYQRRSDLIPNLVNTVKGAANFEQETLTRVIEARAKATSVQIDPTNITPEKFAEFQQAQAGVTSALGRLLAVAENYPDLKANQNYRDLQAQLEGTENRIATARMDFNTAIQSYNNSVRMFPNNIFANMFGFQQKAPFAAEAGAEKAPTVDFSK
jgi:LemA protein